MLAARNPAPDECVTALDLPGQAQVLKPCADLQDEFVPTYLFMSHDRSVVRRVADDAMVMYFGEAVEYVSRDAVFMDPRSDHTRTPFAATPRADVESIGRRLAAKAA
jgi:dipeptide transport system ATP-binding protein